MRKTAITLMVLTLVSKLTGLLREQVFAYFLGTGMVIDIFNTSTTIPFVIFGFVFSSVVAGFIPTYQRVLKDKGDEDASLFVSNLINILLIIALIFVLFIFVFAPLFVTLFAPAYSGVKRELTIIYTRVMSFSLFAVVLSSVFIGYFQIKDKFVVAETPGIIMNIFYVITLIISVWTDNLFVIPFGILLSEYIKYLLFPTNIEKIGYKHKWYLNLHDTYIKDMLKIAIPIIISIAAVDISTISDQSFASMMLENGGVSSMRYAYLILSLVSGVIVVSITTSFYPLVSKYASEGDLQSVKKTLMDGNVSAFILIVPSMIGVMVLAEPIMRLLFQRGVFDSESTRITSGVLFFYMPTLIGQTMNQIYTRGFYSLSNTKTPIIITFVQVILNIILNYILSRIWGLNGLALATSISSLVAGCLSIYLFKKEYGQLGGKQFVISIVKILITSIIMGLVTFFIYHALSSIHYVIALLIATILSILVYGFLIIFTRIPEVMKMVNQIYRKAKRLKK